MRGDPMPVADIMTRRIISVSAGATVEELAEMFQRFRIHHILVVDGRQLLGVVSDRDVLRFTSPYVNTHVASEKDRFTLTRKAEKIMTGNPVTLRDDAGIRDAAKRFLEFNVSLFPVVDKSGALVGVLSWKDVMRYIIA